MENTALKKIINMLLLVYFLFLFSLYALTNNVFAVEGEDRVEIVSLSPNHYENYTDAVTFTATIKYSLQTKEQGIVYFGFNTDEPGYYELDFQEGDHVVVSKGEGVVTLTQTVVPVDWNSGIGYMQQFLDGRSELITEFKAYTNISEYPHEATWTPLAIYSAAVTELPESITEVYFGDSNNRKSVQFKDSLENMLKAGNSTEYNPQLAHLLMALCNSVHDEDNMAASFKSMGFMDYVTDYKLKDPWLSYGLAKKELPDGSVLVLVVARGTVDLKENLSNLDAVWLKGNRHKGFADASDGLKSRLAEFLGTANFENIRFVLTGHSRGGGAINLLAADMIDAGVPVERLYDYNFACPDVEKMTSEKAQLPQYASIFNIGNVNDFVTWVPSTVFESGDRSTDGVYWNKYGNSYWYAKDWEDENTLLPKLPGNIETIINRINNYHGQEKYLDFLGREEKLDVYKDRQDTTEYIRVAAKKREQTAREKSKNEASDIMEKFRQEYSIDRVNVFCPVDIKVLDSEGNILAYTREDVPYVEDIGKSYVSVFTEEDKKCIFIDNLYNYNIVVIGNDEGEMLFEMQSSFDGENFTGADQKYNDVRILKDKTFKWEKNKDDVKMSQLLVVDPFDRNDVIARVQQDGSEIDMREPKIDTDSNKETTKHVKTEDDLDKPKYHEPEKPNFIVGTIIVSALIIVLILVIAVIAAIRRYNKK